MAETKIKGERLEKAIATLVAQMPKEVPKRDLTPGAFAALICYLAEECGAKFTTPEARAAFREAMTDGDCAYASNMRKYLTARGFLPDKAAAAAAEYK